MYCSCLSVVFLSYDSRLTLIRLDRRKKIWLSLRTKHLYFKISGWRKLGPREFDGWVFSPGRFKDIGKLTGNGLIYLYSDYKTALIGDWNNGKMIQAKPVKLKGFRYEYPSIIFSAIQLYSAVTVSVLFH